MNAAQIKSLLVFSVFAIIGFGPVSPGCLIGMYIVIYRPEWFLGLIKNMYAGQTIDQVISTESTYQVRRKVFLNLLGLFIIDILPIPVTPALAFAIILRRPHWFYRVVMNVYQ